jgi:hypothetical protein
MTQAFHAESWVNQAVRTSRYQIPEFPPFYGDLSASPEDLAAALLAVSSHVSDKGSARHALLPPRIPMDVPIPEAWKTLFSFEQTIKTLVKTQKDPIHPSVFHALLSVALNQEGDQRNDWIDAVAPVFKDTPFHQPYWQPTLTQASWVRPQWFKPALVVTPSIRGGDGTERQGVMTSLNILLDKMRINAAQLLTYPGMITREKALYPESIPHWSAMADKAFFGPNPLTTSLWLLGLMEDKRRAWDRLNPGAAIWSPLYTNGEIDALAANAVSYCKPGYPFRPGAGISDIYPYKDDPVLVSFMNMTPLLDAPFSYSTWISLKNLSDHPGSPVGITREWAKKQVERIDIVKVLGMIPSGSAFAATGDGQLKSVEISVSDHHRLKGMDQNFALAALHDMATTGPTPDNMRILSQVLFNHQKDQPLDTGLAAGFFASHYVPVNEVRSRTSNEKDLAVVPVFSPPLELMEI